MLYSCRPPIDSGIIRGDRGKRTGPNKQAKDGKIQMVMDGFKLKEKNLFWNLGETKINIETGQESADGVVVSGVVGEYTEGDTVSFSGDPVGRYKISATGFFVAGDDEHHEVPSGTWEVTVLGSTLLDEYFETEKDPILVGTDVYVQHTGQTKTKSSNRPLKTFDVSVKE